MPRTALSAAGVRRPSGILTGLTAYWPLQEASGGAQDIINSLYLTPTGGPTQAAGPGTYMPQSRLLASASSQRLTRTDNGLLGGGSGSFMIGGFFYAVTTANATGLVGKFTAAGSQKEYMLRTREGGGNSYYEFTVSADGAAEQALNSGLSDLVAGAWTFVVCWLDAPGETMNIQVNNGTALSAAHATGVFDSTSAFGIGTRGDAADTMFNGRAAGVFWVQGGFLTATERSWLYNSGQGRLLMAA